MDDLGGKPHHLRKHPYEYMNDLQQSGIKLGQVQKDLPATLAAQLRGFRRFRTVKKYSNRFSKEKKKEHQKKTEKHVLERKTQVNFLNRETQFDEIM